MSIAEYFSRPEHESVKDEQQLHKLLRSGLLQGGEEIRVCGNVEEYDPVLKSHFRLGSQKTNSATDRPLVTQKGGQSGG
jgi:hypothetical protein